MDTVKVYSPSSIVFTFGGVTVEGWESIQVEKDYPDFKLIPGIRGKNSRVRSKNTAATVTIELTQTSIFNEVFSTILKYDRIQGGMRIQFILRDLLGKEVFTSDEAFIVSDATRSYGAEIGTRLWTISCLSSRENDTSNSFDIGSIFDISPTTIRNIISRT